MGENENEGHESIPPEEPHPDEPRESTLPPGENPAADPDVTRAEEAGDPGERAGDQPADA